MTSSKQEEANRRNAEKSTGPKTAAGRQSVSQNALTHGLTSQTVVLPDEEPSAFAEVSRRFHAHHRPLGPQEELLVERIAELNWWLGRVGRIESGILSWQYHEELLARLKRGDSSYDYIRELQGNMSNPEALEVAELRFVKDMVSIGAQAFMLDATGADTLGKLTRYETSLENSLFKALKQLQELQAGRVEPTP